MGALEIDGCENAPFVVRRDYSKKLIGGHSWIREGRQFRDANPEDLDAIREHVGRAHAWEIAAGFNDRAECELLQLEIPDTSNPPSRQEQKQVKKTMDWKKTTMEELGTINTHMFRLMHVRQHGSDAEFDSRDLETLVDVHDKGTIESAIADDHFFYEEKGAETEPDRLQPGRQSTRGR